MADIFHTYKQLQELRKLGVIAPLAGQDPYASFEDNTFAVSQDSTPEEKQNYEDIVKQNPGQAIGGAAAQGAQISAQKGDVPEPEQLYAMNQAWEQEKQSSPIRDLANAPRKPAPISNEAAPKEASAGSILDFGLNPTASKEGLQDAIDQRNTRQLLANLGSAFNTFSGGLAKTGPVDNTFYNNLAKQAEQSVTDYEKKVEFQKQDPKSAYSQGLRDYFKKKLGIEIKGDAAASDLEKLMPFAVREYEAKLERERIKHDKEEDRNLRRELKGEELAARKEMAGMKAEKDTGKADTRATDKANADFMKMAEKLSGAKASSRSAFGKAALNKAAAERIETLIAGRDLNDLDTREIQEVARSMDALLAQGQPTITGTHELVPQTWRTGAAKIAEYITNQRQGAGAKSFIKQMVKTVGREKELAQKQMNQYRQELVPGYEHLEKVDPERFNKIIFGSSVLTDSASAAVPEATGGLVKVKSKKTGTVKTLSAESAKKYLANPDFEEVK